MAEAVDAHRLAAPAAEPTRIVHPARRAVDDAGLHDRAGRRTACSSCAARRPERWVRQTNFDNDEAVGYLADRLARLGVEDALAKAGAEPG